MGKRELVIAALFVVFGFVVYQVTAPPADPSSTGFSLRRMADEIRREMRGQRETAETTFTATRPVAPAVTEVRLVFPIGTVTITGEDRDDTSAEMHVRSTGYDSAEAERLAKASVLEFDEAGELLIVTAKFPVEGRQTPTLTLRIPSRLGVRMDDKGSALEISDVASVLIGSGRARTTVQPVAGEVTLTQRGSQLTVADVGSLKLTTMSGANARVARVRGDSTFSLQTGELVAEELSGTVEVESRSAELQFDKLQNVSGTVRINANLGEVVMIGLAADTRIDGRRTEIRIEHAGGAPLAVYNEGETIELTVPPVGFTLDARATGGRISVDPSLPEAGLASKSAAAGGTADDARTEESHVTGSVRGGGPPITLRATRGDIVLRAR
jgi:hypothetical protein